MISFGIGLGKIIGTIKETPEKILFPHSERIIKMGGILVVLGLGLFYLAYGVKHSFLLRLLGLILVMPLFCINTSNNVSNHMSGSNEEIKGLFALIWLLDVNRVPFDIFNNRLCSWWMRMSIVSSKTQSPEIIIHNQKENYTNKNT